MFEQIELIVDEEAAVIEVRRTHRRPVVIHQNRLGMEDAGLVLPDPYARRPQAAIGGARGPLGDGNVALARHQQAHVQASPGSVAQRRLAVLVGDEVGSGQPDPVTRCTERIGEFAVQYVPAAAVAVGHQLPAGVRYRWPGRARVGIEVADGILHEFTLEPQVGVAPPAGADGGGRTVPMNVEAAQIGGRVVHDQQLAVVAPMVRQRPPPRPGAAPVQLDAGGAQRGQPRTGKHAPGADGIDAQSDQYSARGRTGQEIEDRFSGLIVREDVGLQTDGGTGRRDIRAQIGVERVTLNIMSHGSTSGRTRQMRGRQRKYLLVDHSGRSC